MIQIKCLICVSVCVYRSVQVQVCALRPWRRGVARIRKGERRVTMTTGENVPGDSEIVEMLIVHFQSSIKFNSHSASTCYSNSVTEYTSGMYSYSSISPSTTPLSPPPSL